MGWARTAKDCNWSLQGEGRVSDSPSPASKISAHGHEFLPPRPQQLLAALPVHLGQPARDLIADGIRSPPAARGGRRLPAPASIASISLSCSRSWAVILSAVAASCALSALRHRIEAQPSGEITE